eukprot:TRINITY_DN8095_c0_g1_i1.p1 TRINITY_DN8095_c0_g1~~TRINITY_DN8095_c0_g1_i1.p1  ORF type:complete len:837 (+),score=103.31 TRINITY_DN8095_c0_g1_i1:355-2865(+)
MPLKPKIYGKQLSRDSSSERNMKIPLRQEEQQLERQQNDDLVLSIDQEPLQAKETDGGIWRGSSYDFMSELEKKPVEHTDSGRSFDFQAGQASDPPTKLIEGFLEKQKHCAQRDIDFDPNLEDFSAQSLPTVPENQPISSEHSSPQKELTGRARSPSASPRDFRVSFDAPTVQIGSPVYPSRKDSSTGSTTERDSARIRAGGDDDDPAEILKCSGRASPTVNFNRSKTRSRLIDPPPPVPDSRVDGTVDSGYYRSGQQIKSGQLRSGFLGKNNNGLEKLEEEEDDPFKDEDLPTEFRKVKCGFLFVLQILGTLISTAAVICSVMIPWLSRRTVWDLHLWKWCSLALALFSGRILSGFLIRILVFFFERNFMLRKRVLYFVYGLKSPVQNCLWLVIVIIVWHYLFDKKVQQETRSKTLQYVNKALVCLVVGTFIWLLKTLCLKVLASRYHVSTYFDRIQEALFNQYVLETLSGPPMMEIERIQKEEEKLLHEVAELKEAGATVPSDLKKSGLIPGVKGTGTPRSGVSGKSGRIGKSGRSLGMRSGRKDESGREEEGITIDQLHKLNQKNISAWNMKRLMNIVRHGVLSTLDERFQHDCGDDESATQIKSEWEAKIAAKKIFRNVAKPGAKYIGLGDLMRFLPQKEAIRAMSLFEGGQESNRVTKASLKNWAVSVFRERRALALTLSDTKTAVKTLHQMVNVVVGVVIIIIFLLILGIATTHILVAVSSQILLVVFMFGNTCKTVFESIIFLFVMHPFDVGDRCSVEGVQMVVEEMNILTTVFLRYDNEKIYYPNSVLATKPISNFYRSPDMGDSIDFSIHMSTPMEKLSILKEKLRL